MANTYEKQFLFSKYGKFTLRSGTVTFSGTGAVASSSGPGLTAVTKLATGIYQIKFKDNFSRFISGEFNMYSGTTGGGVGDGTFTANTLYQIGTVGNTPWSTVGFDGNYTPAVGSVFVASGTGASGTNTGFAIALTPSTIDMIEIAQNPQKMLQNNSGTAGTSIIIQTLASTGPGTTTLIATSPVAGSQMTYNIYFADTSVTPF